MKTQRTKWIRVRASVEEVRTIDAAAAANNMGRSEYVRSVPEREMLLRGARQGFVVWWMARCERHLSCLKERLPADEMIAREVVDRALSAVLDIYRQVKDRHDN